MRVAQPWVLLGETNSMADQSADSTALVPFMGA
jgi:hypothetical protein